MDLRLRHLAALLAVALVPPLFLAWRADPILAGLRGDMAETVRAHAEAVVAAWLAERGDEASRAVHSWAASLSTADPPPARLFERPGRARLTRRQQRAVEVIERLGPTHGLASGRVSIVADGDGGAVAVGGFGAPDERGADAREMRAAIGASGATWLVDDEPLLRWPAEGDAARADGAVATRGGAVWSWQGGAGTLRVSSAAAWRRTDEPGAALVLTGDVEIAVEEAARRLASAVAAPVVVSRWLPGRDYTEASLLVVDARGRVAPIGDAGRIGTPLAVVDVDLAAVGREETRQLARALAAALAVGTGIAVLLALVMAPLVSRPLRRLTAAVSRVAAGEPPAGPMPSGAGDVGRLASAVDGMLASLSREHARRVDAERRAAWQDIARKVAHEVRNPLSPIRLAVDNLERARARGPERLGEALDEEADAIRQEVRRLDRLVREFSEFARLPQPSPRPVRLGEVVEAAVRGQIPDGAPIACEVRLDPGLDRPASADPDLLTQAVSNLARNAVQAIGGRDGRITVAVRAATARDGRGGERPVAEVVVEDDGPGIPPELCETIFEPYVTGRAGEGTGLGLAIARRIVLDHGGTIEAGRAEGGGARFVVRLPLDGRPLEAA